MMNANQYPQNAYYQGAPGYPGKAYPTPPNQSANMQNGHWPPPQQQMSPVAKKPYPGQPMEQQPPQSPYHSQQQAAAYQQQQQHPNAGYYSRPSMHSSNNSMQQYPPANMSPQTGRHYPVPQQPQHPSQQQQQQRFSSNSYPNSSYRNDSEAKPSFPYGPGANYNYEQSRASMQQQQQHQSYNQQQQQQSMYSPSPNMSPYPPRHYLESRNYANHMNHHHDSAMRMRQYQANAAAMNAANYGGQHSSQARLQMSNSMTTPPPAQSPAQVTPVKSSASIHPNFNMLRSASPLPAPPAMIANEATLIKKEVNDRHLRQALSAANASAPLAVQPAALPPAPMLAKEIKIDTVESTRPVFKKIKPLTSVGPVDNRKIMMSLKSGLLAETTWAFDVLNILSNNGTFKLTTVPSLLTNLLDYYKCFLNSIFDDLFDDTENDYQIKLNQVGDKSTDLCKEEFDRLIRKDEKVYLLDSTNYTYKSRNGLPVQVKNEPRLNSSSGLPIVNCLVNLEEMVDYKYFQDGNGLPTNHIVTNMDPIRELLSFAPVKCSTKKLLNGDAKEEKAASASSEEGGTKKCKRKLQYDTEAELYRSTVNATLCPRRESLESLIKRCHCLSTIIRNLSFVPDNAILMAHNSALLLVLARLLAFSHEHYEKKSFAMILNEVENKSQEKENKEAAEIFSDFSFETLHLIRMNTFVTLSNMSEFIDLADFPDKIILPLLDSLLHWAVCPSAYAKDPHPPDSLSFQLLAFETIAKLSMKLANIDLFLATPPFSRIEEFYKILVRCTGREEEQVLRELSIVILSNFAAADVLSARIILHLDYSIINLLTFIEQYEYCRRTQLYNRFSYMEPFTITYMLKQAASTLRTLATECDRADLHLIKRYEDRVVDLTMSHLLDPEVSHVLADLTYILSRSDKST